MDKPWLSEQNISLELAKILIEEQFPQFEIINIKLLGEWRDNTAFLVNDCYVFRFPRKEEAVLLLQNELRD